jgi:predicted nucleic acid-binding protein
VKVLVDTSVWSLALRRVTDAPGPEVLELLALIDDQRVQMLGPIRQELLSGLRLTSQFAELKNRLRSFADLPLLTDDYVTAASFFNRCRSLGVQGSNTDFLICAVSARTRFAIFTTNHDFAHFARHLPIQLHAMREAGPRGEQGGIAAP